MIKIKKNKKLMGGLMALTLAGLMLTACEKEKKTEAPSESNIEQQILSNASQLEELLAEADDTAVMEESQIAEAAKSDVVEAKAEGAEIDLENSQKLVEANVAIGEKVFDNDTVTLTTDGISYDSEKVYVYLTVKNKINKDICLYADDICVNDYVVPVETDGVIAAGADSFIVLMIQNVDLNACDISVIRQLTFELEVMDNATYVQLFETGDITLETDQASAPEEAKDHPGEVLYDAGGIKVINKGIHQLSEAGDEIVLLCINDSDKAICVGLENAQLEINGVTYSNPGVSEIPAHKKSLHFLYAESHHEDEGGSVIQKASFSLEIMDDESMDVIDTTAVYTFEKPAPAEEELSEEDLPSEAVDEEPEE